MEQSTAVKTADQQRAGEPYSEPLLIKHQPLRNVTGQKYGEKSGFDKVAVEA